MLLLLGVGIACRAQITAPGWYRADAQKSRNHGAALASLNVPEIRSAALAIPLAATNGVPAVPVAEAVTPHIQALADGLQHDPVRIFDYVHDHIKFVLYFGSKKGAELTLLEKSGNDFDQAALLVALLRAAGYTNAAYQFGWMYFPYDDPAANHRDLHHWWRLSLSDTSYTNATSYVGNLLDNRGYPDFGSPNDGTNLAIQRIWVTLTIGHTNYNLDPAFKISEPVNGMSLTNLLGGTGVTISNALLAVAGGTNTGNFVQNLNEPAIRARLSDYTSAFLSGLQSNTPNASVQDVLGGWQIVAADNAVDFTTNTSFQAVTFRGMPVQTWANEPTNIMSWLIVAFAGTDYQWLMPQLQGQRLSLVFDNNGIAQLWQDDSLLVQRSTGSSDTSVILYAHHPAGGWNTTNNAFINGYRFDQIVTNTYQRKNAAYALLYAFEPDWGWLQQRQNKLDGYLQQGLPNNSRQVLTENLNVMGLNWMVQTAQTEQILAAQLGILPQYFHRLGRMAQESGNGYYVDAYMQLTGEFSNGGLDASHLQTANTHFDLTSIFASALEHGIIEQLQNSNLVAASTVKMLQIANTNGQPIYLASTTNWTTAFNVKSQLSHYDSSALTTIGNLISTNYYVLLPQDGANAVSHAKGSWAGYGYEARAVARGLVSDSKMIISGGYSGGYSSDPDSTVDPPYCVLSANDQPYYLNKTPLMTLAPTVADPVDAGNGTFQVENTDLSIGQAEPRGITLTRYYNGTRHFNNPAGLAPGWTHNYCINAAIVAGPQASLGGTTPAQAAPMLVATTAAVATYNGGLPDPKNWLTTALIGKWGVDQLTKGAVSINLGKDTLQFIRQPNGIFTPPANCTWTLASNGPAFTLTQRHGNTFKFDAAGRLTNIVDQYGQSESLTYNKSNWVSTVTDWKNRKLTFNYSAAPTQTRLTSVSDGTRTVFYQYAITNNAQGDLLGFTDANGSTSSYLYDTNHQITATFDALGQLVVTNLYDSQFHITTQYTEGNVLKNWNIYWTGWQTSIVDPLDYEQDYLYDDQGRLVLTRDALGNETAVSYDGQNHIVSTVSPLLETNRSAFDASNNLILQIDPLGYTNGFQYDADNNLVRSTDARGNTTSFRYNVQFSLLFSTNAAGEVSAYAYNSDGTVGGKQSGGVSAQFGYDSLGQLNSISYVGMAGSELFANNVYGDVTNHTDARGFSTAFQYDLCRQLTNTVQPTNLLTATVYDRVGNVVKITDPLQHTTTKKWGATRHLTSTTLPTSDVWKYSYDTRDMPKNTTDPLGNVTRNTEDANGRLSTTQDPVKRTTAFGYDADGRKTATTNGLNEVASRVWNARGELLMAVDGAKRAVSYVYDGAGSQVFLTNRNGKTWQFQYDAVNRLTNTITPLGRKTARYFNSVGLLDATTDPAGQTTARAYDAKGRLLTTVDNMGFVRYTYDANDNITSISDGQTTNSWGYDAYNRVSNYTDALGHLIQYRYDGAGNLTNLIYPGGKNVFYTYDKNNHIMGVRDWGGRQSIIAYDADSRVTSITRPNGTSRIITYDGAGEVTNIVEQTAAGFPIALFQLNWDGAARMQWEFAAPLPHSNAPTTRAMTYDADNQLVSVNGHTVSMDPNGNMVAGPLTNDSITAYSYDSRNRLISAGGVTNVYDAAGNRIARMTGSGATSFIINPNATLPQVLIRTAGNKTTYYIYGAGLLYEINEGASGESTITYHFDYRGSTTALTDDGGRVTDRIEYSLYGPTTLRTGSSDTPFLFNGRAGVMTEPNGLLYMRARYYSPYLCRFVNADPSGFAGGFNLYTYASGSPVNKIDPEGFGSVDSAMETPPASLTFTFSLTDSVAVESRRPYLPSLSINEIANVIYNETRSLSGPNLDVARYYIAQAIINGDIDFGERRPLTAPTIATVAPGDQTIYAAALLAASEAVLDHSVGIDPTHGAFHFNFRNNTWAGPFETYPLSISVGPFDNSYPGKLHQSGIYANIYGGSQ